MKGKIILVILLTFINFAAINAKGQDDSSLTFCISPDNLPMSSSSPPYGIDVEFARAVAKELNATAEFIWIESEDKTFEQALLEKKCDIALGVVVENSPKSYSLPGVVKTIPYYRTGFAVIRRPGSKTVRNLDEIGNERIAVEGESISNFALRQRGKRVFVRHNTEDVIKAIANGQALYGYVWNPLAAWLIRERKDIIIERQFEPVDKWDFAMAVRESESRRLKEINQAIRKLVENDTARKIFTSFSIPYSKPRI